MVLKINQYKYLWWCRHENHRIKLQRSLNYFVQIKYKILVLNTYEKLEKVRKKNSALSEDGKIHTSILFSKYFERK